MIKDTKDKFASIVEEFDDFNELASIIKDSRVTILKSKAPRSPAELVSLYNSIATPIVQSDKVKGRVEEHGELIKVREDGLFTGAEDGELEWHSAGMNRTHHEDVVAMYMHQPAIEGGATYFSDHQLAFDDLEDSTKEFCRKLKSKTFTYKKEDALKGNLYGKIFSDEETMLEFKDIDGHTCFERQVSRKDLVTISPLNNKEGLYFPWAVIRGFLGATKQEQHSLYYKLKKHVQQDKYVYKHDWDLYDICFSEQWHSLHRRDPFSGDRELWRTGLMMYD